MKIFLSIPSDRFQREFLENEVRIGATRGDMILYYLKDKPKNIPTTGIFKHSACYFCTMSENNVIIFGESEKYSMIPKTV